MVVVRKTESDGHSGYSLLDCSLHVWVPGGGDSNDPKFSEDLTSSWLMGIGALNCHHTSSKPDIPVAHHRANISPATEAISDSL